MPTLDQKIAALEDKLSRAKKKKRDTETREKIILGALVLSAIKDDAPLKQKVVALLNGVSREADKAAAKNLLEQIAHDD
jgi:hypothetical protein